ncbi:hypothetical protein MUCCIDRAFT_80206 [Mucor lusitanicus CBS 277.49]|uniref:DUF1308 domain-containing protein n=2 Tax=Mucor circinelloides f. lusitanicus TaxID=29924 RepID=A0A168MLZ5_MUCCL|nr:hypothetical protein MUCCIDRAFT_80206 [Mucor lusitanicus CBS 277.49]
MSSDDEDHVEDPVDLVPSIQLLRDKCTTILKQCKAWNDQQPIEGLHRYTNSLTAELHFIDKLLENPKKIKKEHVQSTNLSYLEAVFEALSQAGERRNEVMRLASAPAQNNSQWMSRAAMIRNHSVKVDIVAENGLVWIKVIARNAKAFRHELMGLEWDDSSSSCSSSDEDEDDGNDGGKQPSLASSGDFDSLPIFKKAREYLKTAQAHHVQFHTPIVVFAFMRIKPEEDVFVQRIMDRLTEIGIVVHMQDPHNTLQASYLPLLKDVGDLDHLTTPSINLDVSSALAILSELSHHVCLPKQVSAIPIQVQAEREALVPALPQILPYITGKKLCIIQTAYDRLKDIVHVVGGPNETARFNYLFREHLGLDLEFDQELWTVLPSLSVEIMPDASSEAFVKLLDPPSQKSKLNNGRKIRTRFSDFHAKIFGSGDHYKMTTLTSIQWMETALKDAGVQGALLVSHEPRSLAEKKMESRGALSK